MFVDCGHYSACEFAQTPFPLCMIFRLRDADGAPGAIKSWMRESAPALCARHVEARTLFCIACAWGTPEVGPSITRMRQLHCLRAGDARSFCVFCRDRIARSLARGGALIDEALDCLHSAPDRFRAGDALPSCAASTSLTSLIVCARRTPVFCRRAFFQNIRLRNARLRASSACMRFSSETPFKPPFPSGHAKARLLHGFSSTDSVFLPHRQAVPPTGPPRLSAYGFSLSRAGTPGRLQTGPKYVAQNRRRSFRAERDGVEDSATPPGIA